MSSLEDCRLIHDFPDYQLYTLLVGYSHLPSCGMYMRYSRELANRIRSTGNAQTPRLKEDAINFLTERSSLLLARSRESEKPKLTLSTASRAPIAPLSERDGLFTLVSGRKIARSDVANGQRRAYSCERTATRYPLRIECACETVSSETIGAEA